MNQTTTEPQKPKRQREVTNSPRQEFAVRPGEIEPLPDSIVSILVDHHHVFAEVRGHRVMITWEKNRFYFASPSSNVCLNRSDTGEKLLFRFNPLDLQSPERCKFAAVHACERNGSYIESIPIQGQAEWFDYDSPETQRQVRNLAAFNANTVAQANHLMRDKTKERLQREKHNRTQAVAAVSKALPKTTGPGVEKGPETPRKPSRFPQAEDFEKALQGVENARTSAIDRHRQRKHYANVANSIFDDE